jgi:hypothetical protein
MSPAHPELVAGRWWTLSLVEQLANVGTLDLTIADPRHLHRLKELTRTRETLLDYFLGDNDFGSTQGAWRRYFAAFGLAAALRKERSREQ